MEIEAVNVDFASTAQDMSALKWLFDGIAEHNANNPDSQVAVTVSVDGVEQGDLASFFSAEAPEGFAAAFAAPMTGFGGDEDDSIAGLITPITAEGDYDVLHLDLLSPQNGEVSDGSISLSGLGNLGGNGLGSFDVLDITDNKDTVLDIDTLLSSFNENGKLLVRSEDSQDTVSLSQEWTQQEAAVTENGVNYTSFTNNLGEELLIQQNIVILTSN